MYIRNGVAARTRPTNEQANRNLLADIDQIDPDEFRYEPPVVDGGQSRDADEVTGSAVGCASLLFLIVALTGTVAALVFAIRGGA